ncbi:hypothetical protein [Paenibacillus pinihumi]|uniref:hypothetical protein n=1 Tax=Paenibacillus pinihumi TaxID=669462 RepID=UPI0003FA3DD3|nr:hypothetical protein [Paenibacillus pinihumi]
MEIDKDQAGLSPKLQELIKTIEDWYVWLSSSPSVMFNPSDMSRMAEPVSRFIQSSEWLSESALVKHDWFVQNGAKLLLERLEKGDFDIYEQ